MRKTVNSIMPCMPKFSLIDYGALFNNEVRLGEGFELGYFRNIGKNVNIGFPDKSRTWSNCPNEHRQFGDHRSGRGAAILQYTTPDIQVQPYLSVGAGYVLEQFENGHAQLPVAFGINFRVSKYAGMLTSRRRANTGKPWWPTGTIFQLGAGFMTLLHQTGTQSGAPARYR